MNINNIYPSIDLHGEYLIPALIRVDEFINDSITLHNNKIVIIHGNGDHILKNGIHKMLKKDKRIQEFKLDNMNPGQTVITLKNVK